MGPHLKPGVGGHPDKRQMPGSTNKKILGERNWISGWLPPRTDPKQGISNQLKSKHNPINGLAACWRPQPKKALVLKTPT